MASIPGNPISPPGNPGAVASMPGNPISPPGKPSSVPGNSGAVASIPGNVISPEKLGAPGTDKIGITSIFVLGVVFFLAATPALLGLVFTITASSYFFTLTREYLLSGNISAFCPSFKRYESTTFTDDILSKA